MTAVGDRTRALVAPASIPIADGLPSRLSVPSWWRGSGRWSAPLAARRAGGGRPAPAPSGPGTARVVGRARGALRLAAGLRPAVLGLAVVDACARGRFPTPLEAVGPVVGRGGRPVGARPGGAPSTGSRGWPGWHPGPGPLVLAEAVGWATALWSSFDWSELDPLPQVGGADDQWVCPGRAHRASEGPIRAAGAPGRPAPGAGRAGSDGRVSDGGDRGRWPWCRCPAATPPGLARGARLPGPGGRVAVALPAGAGPGARPVARRRRRPVRGDRRRRP